MDIISGFFQVGTRLKYPETLSTLETMWVFLNFFLQFCDKGACFHVRP